MLRSSRVGLLVAVVPLLFFVVDGAGGCGTTVRSAAADAGSARGGDAAGSRSDAQAPEGGSPLCTNVAGSCLYTLASGQELPSSLAVNQGTLDWTNERAGTVMKVSAAGEPPSLLPRERRTSRTGA